MSEPRPGSAAAHLARVRAFYDAAPASPRWGAREYRALLARCYNRLIPAGASVLEVGCGAGDLLSQVGGGRKAGVELSRVQAAAARERIPGARIEVGAAETAAYREKYDWIVVSDTLNHAGDVQALLERLHEASHDGTRLAINFQNSLWRPLLAFAQVVGLKAPQPENSWLSGADVRNLLHLAGWEVVSRRGELLLPVRIPVVTSFVNRWLAPLAQWFCLTVFIVARPAAGRAAPSPARTVTVVIPARNEAGNVEAAVERTPQMGGGTEIIFVEGHSRDDTWAAIERVIAAHPGRQIRALRQSGEGKGDAVRAGFAAATGEVLMILDADLTAPPEDLPKFYEVLARGRAEFANGVRLVYPMEGEAMQFLNMCANKTFGLIFTWLLGQPVKDTLCGTKALLRSDYERIAANRAHFGDFDPFGDFDLLFGAARLNLRIADVPVRYQARSYGSTNIHRWRHGWLLLRMMMVALRKLRFA